MGWNGGVYIVVPLVEKLKELVPNKSKRREIYETLYDALMYCDWSVDSDTAGIDPLWDEVIGYDEEDEG